MSRLPFKAMETIEAVVRLGSVTKAASELSLSQSAVSNSIRRFEHDLGRQLFVRQGNDFVPTEAAETIAGAAGQAGALLRRALETVADGPCLHDVRVSVSPTLASRWLASRLPLLRASMKPIRLHVSSRVELSDAADLWIRHGRQGRWAGLRTKRLLSETKAPVASPRLVGDNSGDDGEVFGYPLIGVEARPREWAEWSKLAGFSDPVEPDFTFEVTTSAWEAAIAGSGVALGDVDFLKHELDTGMLRRLGRTAMTSYAYYLCRRRQESRPEVMKVWDWFSGQV